MIDWSGEIRKLGVWERKIFVCSGGASIRSGIAIDCFGAGGRNAIANRCGLVLVQPIDNKANNDEQTAFIL